MIDAVRVALTAVRTRDRPHPGDLTVVELQGVPGLLIGVDELRRPHMLLPVGPEQVGGVDSEVASLEVGMQEPWLLAARLGAFSTSPACCSPWQTYSNISSPQSPIAFWRREPIPLGLCVMCSKNGDSS